MIAEKLDALVVGSGPAGLMAASALAESGRKVTVAEAKPSIGRKLLMAGKSGLNLTKDEPVAAFLARYPDCDETLRRSLLAFDPQAVQSWARSLGQDIFTGSSGRVFPKAMKASPLLRSWSRRLGAMAVEFRTNWRWKGWSDGSWLFETSDGEKLVEPQVAVVALGGASWPKLGSDGAWSGIFQQEGIPVRPFRPANAGIAVSWSDHMARHFGEPVKGIALKAGSVVDRGEFVLSVHGLEGGGIYAVTREIRNGAALSLDLAPDMSLQAIHQRLSGQKAKDTIVNRLRKALNLSPVKLALLMEFGRPLPDTADLPNLIKALPIRHAGLRPLSESISTAGGVAWKAVNDGLMLRQRPGVFVAGEMLDWEAPTGGYLLTGCLATGLLAGQRAAVWPAG